jgi:transcriptional regulator with XRE-family HTH domain
MKDKSLRTSSINEFIKDLRKNTYVSGRRRLTQKEVADRIGMKRSIYGEIESGKRKKITVDEFLEIVEVGLRKDPILALQKYKKIDSGKPDKK